MSNHSPELPHVLDKSYQSYDNAMKSYVLSCSTMDQVV